MASESSNSRAVIEFLRQKEYSEVEPLDKGSFGEVFAANSQKHGKVAIKIVQNQNSWHIEELIWPLLNHKNILSLIEIIDMQHLNVKLFVMPKIAHVLDKMLYSDGFACDTNGIKRIKRWLSNILEGLKYLHGSGFSHLDLKLDNVLISADDEALLCDFSGINLTGVPLRRMCAPLQYRPPENYDDIKCNNMEGSKCDMWLYGLTTLNMLTKDWPARRMGEVTDAESWRSNVEPILREALKETTFYHIMKSSFPCVQITSEDLTSAHNFVMSLMHWDMNKRPSAQDIYNHPFLSSTNLMNILPKKSPELKKVSNVVTNPFLDGWTDPGAYCRITSAGDYESPELKKVNNVVTNPFLDGWTDPGAYCRITSAGDYKANVEEQKSVLKGSRKVFEKTEMMEISNLKNNDTSVFPTLTEIFATEKEIPKEKKKNGGKIRHWFANKWNKVFKKKSHTYERFFDDTV